MATLHPMAVHLPIAIALLWPLIDLIGLLTKRPDLSRLAIGLLVLGLVSALLATVTGQAAYDAALELGRAPSLLDGHAQDADLVPWLMLLVLALRTGGAARFGRGAVVASVVAGLLLAGFVIAVGRSGGVLVYEHAVGVAREAAP
jgi:uncharacterized membrane protein